MLKKSYDIITFHLKIRVNELLPVIYSNLGRGDNYDFNLTV